MHSEHENGLTPTVFVVDEPFPEAGSDAFAALENTSILGSDWSWAKYATGGYQPDAAGSESSMEDAFDAMTPGEHSPAPSPPASSPPGSSPAISPSAPSSALSTISSATGEHISGGSDGTAPTARFEGPPYPRSNLFKAFKGNSSSLASTGFLFSYGRPSPTAPTPSLTASFVFGAPRLPPPGSSSSWLHTPPRQPTRAAQQLTNFLSPERRAGAASAVAPAVAAALPEVVAGVPTPPPTSDAVVPGAKVVPALPKTRPAAKQPVEKSAHPALKRRGRPPKAPVEPQVLHNATNGAAASATPVAVMAAPPSQNPGAVSQAQRATVRTQNDAAEPPPAEMKRVRRAPMRADGTAAVGWKKRTNEEMNADAPAPPMQDERKRRKTSAA
ncbi:hypothetical protein C8J57DRAFT_1237637 [Mycena rebaudengoi]|nr:hypothetical protein C8J57DRAFT_1237637 [Mycena rebaudengoi]